MYESPIEKIFGDIQFQIIKHDEEQLMCSVSQAVGYNVDKDELLKALQYDRQQYQKGYVDAMSVIENIKAEIESKEREVEFMNDWNDGYNLAIYDVLQLINKHISGKDK